MNTEEVLKLVEEAGCKAACLKAEDVVTSASFLDVCVSNACGKYGRCWQCPPDTGDIFENIKKLYSFTDAVLYQDISAIEDSFDVEGMAKAAKFHSGAGQIIEKRLPGIINGEYLHLSCGGCNICESCAKEENKPCRFPKTALPAMEAYGIDVYNTTKATPLLYINGQNTVTYFGIILYGVK